MEIDSTLGPLSITFKKSTQNCPNTSQITKSLWLTWSQTLLETSIRSWIPSMQTKSPSTIPIPFIGNVLRCLSIIGRTRSRTTSTTQKDTISRVYCLLWSWCLSNSKMYSMWSEREAIQRPVLSCLPWFGPLLGLREQQPQHAWKCVHQEQFYGVVKVSQQPQSPLVHSTTPQWALFSSIWSKYFNHVQRYWPYRMSLLSTPNKE